MIRDIIKLLNLDDWYGVSEEIDIAKGKHIIPRSIKEGYKQGLRKGYGK